MGVSYIPAMQIKASMPMPMKLTMSKNAVYMAFSVS
jgi:hypothetical protein